MVAPIIVPLPLIPHEYVLIPAVPEKEFEVLFSHTVLLPLIAQAGLAFTVTRLVHVLEQEFEFVIVRLSVNDPGEPAVTVTDWLVVAPMIVPLPLILHE